MSAPQRLGWQVWAAVAAGAFLGAEGRYWLLEAFPPAPAAIDWTTLGINIGASLLLGFLTSQWLRQPAAPFWLKAGLGPGLLGSFSTFSALALTVEDSLARGRPGVWLAYLLLSVAGGLAAAAAGLWLGNRAGGPFRRRKAPGRLP